MVWWVVISTQYGTWQLSDEYVPLIACWGLGGSFWGPWLQRMSWEHESQVQDQIPLTEGNAGKIVRIRSMRAIARWWQRLLVEKLQPSGEECEDYQWSVEYLSWVTWTSLGSLGLRVTAI